MKTVYNEAFWDLFLAGSSADTEVGEMQASSKVLKLFIFILFMSIAKILWSKWYLDGLVRCRDPIMNPQEVALIYGRDVFVYYSASLESNGRRSSFREWSRQPRNDLSIRWLIRWCQLSGKSSWHLQDPHTCWIPNAEEGKIIAQRLGDDQHRDAISQCPKAWKENCTTTSLSW